MNWLTLSVVTEIVRWMSESYFVVCLGYFGDFFFFFCRGGGGVLNFLHFIRTFPRLLPETLEDLKV